MIFTKSNIVVFFLMSLQWAICKPADSTIRKESFKYGYKIILTEFASNEINDIPKWNLDQWLLIPIGRIIEIVDNKRKAIPEFDKFRLQKCSLIYSEDKKIWYYEIKYNLIWNGKVSGEAFFFVVSNMKIIEPKFIQRNFDERERPGGAH